MFHLIANWKMEWINKICSCCCFAPNNSKGNERFFSSFLGQRTMNKSKSFTFYLRYTIKFFFCVFSLSLSIYLIWDSVFDLTGALVYFVSPRNCFDCSMIGCRNWNVESTLSIFSIVCWAYAEKWIVFFLFIYKFDRCSQT